MPLIIGNWEGNWAKGMLTMMDIVWTITLIHSMVWIQILHISYSISNVPYKYNKSKFSWFELVIIFKLDVPSLFFLTLQLPLHWHNPSISKKVFFVWFFCTAHREQQEMLETTENDCLAPMCQNGCKGFPELAKKTLCKMSFVQS
jgi:hypothetical protein